MRGSSSDVLSCLERERLEEELKRGSHPGTEPYTARHLSHRERVALDEREQAAQTRLRDHDAEHGCQR